MGSPLATKILANREVPDTLQPHLFEDARRDNDVKALAAIAELDNLTAELDTRFAEVTAAQPLAAWLGRDGRDGRAMSALACRDRRVNILEVLASQHGMTDDAYQAIVARGHVRLLLALLANDSCPAGIRRQAVGTLPATVLGKSITSQQKCNLRRTILTFDRAEVGAYLQGVEAALTDGDYDPTQVDTDQQLPVVNIRRRALGTLPLSFTAQEPTGSTAGWQVAEIILWTAEHMQTTTFGRARRYDDYLYGHGQLLRSMATVVQMASPPNLSVLDDFEQRLARLTESDDRLDTAILLRRRDGQLQDAAASSRPDDLAKVINELEPLQAYTELHETVARNPAVPVTLLGRAVYHAPLQTRVELIRHHIEHGRDGHVDELLRSNFSMPHRLVDQYPQLLDAVLGYLQTVASGRAPSGRAPTVTPAFFTHVAAAGRELDLPTSLLWDGNCPSTTYERLIGMVADLIGTSRIRWELLTTLGSEFTGTIGELFDTVAALDQDTDSDTGDVDPDADPVDVATGDASGDVRDSDPAAGDEGSGQLTLL